MKYVYTIVEKSEDSNNIEEDFVVYGSFEKALSVCKDLLKQEFEYLESSYEDMELQEDFFINQEKEICEGSISDDDEVVYSVSVKKVLKVDFIIGSEVQKIKNKTAFNKIISGFYQ